MFQVLRAAPDLVKRLSLYVRTRLQEALGEEAADAISSLEAADLPLVKQGSLAERRIHLAIVKLVCERWDAPPKEPSPGQRFREALQLAQSDWRDLLVAAGLEHDNWRDVLRSAGYEPPEDR